MRHYGQHDRSSSKSTCTCARWLRSSSAPLGPPPPRSSLLARTCVFIFAICWWSASGLEQKPKQGQPHPAAGPGPPPHAEQEQHVPDHQKHIHNREVERAGNNAHSPHQAASSPSRSSTEAEARPPEQAFMEEEESETKGKRKEKEDGVVARVKDLVKEVADLDKKFTKAKRANDKSVNKLEDLEKAVEKVPTLEAEITDLDKTVGAVANSQARQSFFLELGEPKIFTPAKDGAVPKTTTSTSATEKLSNLEAVVDAHAANRDDAGNDHVASKKSAAVRDPPQPKTTALPASFIQIGAVDDTASMPASSVLALRRASKLEDLQNFYDKNVDSFKSLEQRVADVGPSDATPGSDKAIDNDDKMQKLGSELEALESALKYGVTQVESTAETSTEPAEKGKIQQLHKNMEELQKKFSTLSAKLTQHFGQRFETREALTWEHSRLLIEMLPQITQTWQRTRDASDKAKGKLDLLDNAAISINSNLARASAADGQEILGDVIGAVKNEANTAFFLQTGEVHHHTSLEAELENHDAELADPSAASKGKRVDRKMLRREPRSRGEDVGENGPPPPT